MPRVASSTASALSICSPRTTTSGFAARPKPLSTAPTCEPWRRGRNRTATEADRQLLAPRRHPAPAYFLRRPRPRGRPLPPTGEPGVWYASSREQGAWAELFRHFVDEGVDPFEVRRRVGRVS